MLTFGDVGGCWPGFRHSNAYRNPKGGSGEGRVSGIRTWDYGAVPPSPADTPVSGIRTWDYGWRWNDDEMSTGVSCGRAPIGGWGRGYYTQPGGVSAPQTVGGCFRLAGVYAVGKGALGWHCPVTPRWRRGRWLALWAGRSLCGGQGRVGLALPRHSPSAAAAGASGCWL